jgi:hypothetical protein
MKSRVYVSIGRDVTETSARKKFDVAVYTIRRQKGISNLMDIHPEIILFHWALKLSLGYETN